MGSVIDKLKKCCPCRRKTRPENRTVFVGNRIPESCEVFVPEQYPSNRIVSSKYTAWNFIPKNLFEQFHRIANFYFLIVAFIELFVHTSVSPWTSILPLIFVVVITAIKQGYEDWIRHKADREVNNRTSLVLRNGKLEDTKSMHIQVGDIIKVTANSDIPCDMVLLSSSDADGHCYITTANLDGETNLKMFYSPTETRPLQSEDQYESFYGCIECQQPITDLYRFVGRINIYDVHGKQETQSLGAENVLLRGSRLKNTPYVYGCAIYTGQDTKISLNSRYQSHKYSRVEKKMNVFLIIYLSILVSFSVIWEIITIGYYSMSKTSPENMWYVGGLPDFWNLGSWDQFVIILEDFLSYMILCNYIIPISMYVTVELQKFFGSMYFEWDVEMFDEITNEPAKAMTSDLNEELGQIQYLFTDKTGTLTENEMQFRQCSVDGIIYEDVNDHLCIKPTIPGVIPAPIPTLTKELEWLFTVLALCHTVHIDRLRSPTQSENDRSVDGQDYDYQSSSPDEKALVEASAKFGVVYHGEKDDQMELTICGQLKRFKLHHVLEFDSGRKRMSVIVEDEQGQIFLLCKGAETAIFERVTEGDIEAIEKHVNDFAVLGLRTLVISDRQLTRDEFSNYDKILRNAKQVLGDREEKLMEAFDIVESHLRLVGATGIEDKLQDGVPATISALRDAGIQVWVLTGDKEETAVNISYSTGHFQHDMTPLSLTKQSSSDECRMTLENFNKLIEDYKSTEKHALVVDGKSLSFALESHSELLRTVCEGCVTVLCCRMSPIQKAMVVKLMKSSPSNPTTAAIGDGANDVSMIQEAHVGLGIVGKEGRQAVRASDYAFGRFRFLQRALLVHGHYFYLRIAILVQYFFYKNVAMITAQLYLTFFSGFSAQTLYSGYYLMFFNITFTALPILLFGLYEMHVPAKNLMNRPQLYKSIRNNKLLSNRNFLKWNLMGLWHSLVFFFGTYFAVAPGNSPFESGWGFALFDMGFVVMTACVITVNIKLMLETYRFNGVIVGGFIISIGGYFLTTIIECIILWPFLGETLKNHGSMQTMLSSGYIWLLLLLLTVTALLPDILSRAIQDNFSPLHQMMRYEEGGLNNNIFQLISYNKVSDSVNPPQTKLSKPHHHCTEEALNSHLHLSSQTQQTDKPFTGSTSDLLSACADVGISPLHTIAGSHDSYRRRGPLSPELWPSSVGVTNAHRDSNGNSHSRPRPIDDKDPEKFYEIELRPNKYEAVKEDVDLGSIEMQPVTYSRYAYDNAVFRPDA